MSHRDLACLHLLAQVAEGLHLCGHLLRSFDKMKVTENTGFEVAHLPMQTAQNSPTSFLFSLFPFDKNPDSELYHLRKKQRLYAVASMRQNYHYATVEICPPAAEPYISALDDTRASARPPRAFFFRSKEEGAKTVSLSASFTVAGLSRHRKPIAW
jgi:hypothetical protein